MSARHLATRLGLCLSALLLSACAGLGEQLQNPAGESTAAGGGTPASATPQKEAYELHLDDIPNELRALLQQHLDLARFQHIDANERLSRVELERLAAAAPAQGRSLLETEGYFNAELSVDAPQQGSDGLLQLRLHLKPGPRTQVKRLDLSFAGALQEPVGEDAQRLAERLRQQVLSDWSLPVGKPWRQSQWSAAKTEALSLVRSSGYPLARWVLTASRVQTESNEAELELQMDSGPLFRLGPLQIEGLKLHSEASVQRLAGFSPGQPYSERALLDFQERLQQTQLFDGASVDIQPDAAQADAVPVLVRLREAPRQQATTGIGYSANTGQRVTLEHLNRQPLGLPLRALTKLDLARDLRSASIELSSRPQTDMRRNVGSLTIEEDRTVTNPITNVVTRLGRLRETASDERLDYLELLRSHERFSDHSVNAGAISLATQRGWRRVDSKLLPTDGYTASLALNLGRADSDSARSGPFGRYSLRLTGYKPLGGWFGTARIEVAQAIASDSVQLPDKLLFRAGGDDSVRGYAYRGLSPTLDGESVGGRVMLTSSLEVAHPFSARMPALWGAAFIDAGQAATRWSTLHPVVGWGFGVRWRSPVGPLKLDIARGNALQQWRLHFSVGVTL